MCMKRQPGAGSVLALFDHTNVSDREKKPQTARSVVNNWERDHLSWIVISVKKVTT